MDHRLPDPGWLPDPSEIGVERDGDGRAWTAHTRQRVSRVSYATPPAVRRSWADRVFSGWPFWPAVVVVVAVLAAPTCSSPSTVRS